MPDEGVDIESEDIGLAKKASSGYLWSQIARIIEFALIFVQSIIIARFLGPEHQGYYAIIIGFGQLISFFLNFGFEAVVNKYIAIYSDEKKKAAGLFLLIFKLRALIAFVTYSLIFIFAHRVALLLSNEMLTPWLRIASIMFFTGLVYSPMEFLYVGRLRLKEISIIKSANLLMTIILIYIVLRMGYGISGIVSMMAIVNLITIIVIFIQTKDLYKETVVPSNLKPMFIFGLFLWLNGLVGFFIQKQIDVVFLSIFKLPGEQIGYYYIGVGLADRISMILISGLFGVSLSALYMAFKQGGYEKTKAAWWILLKMSIGISVPALTFVYLLGRDIIILFYGEEYIPAIVLFKAFVIVHLVLRTFGYDQHITALYAIEKEKTVFLIRAIWGGICIVAEILLIPVFGVWGALIATSSSLIGVTFTEMIVIGRILGGYFPRGFFIKIALATIVSVIPIYFIPLFGIKAILVKGVIFVIILISMLLIIKPFDRSDYGYLSKSFPRFERYIRLFSTI